MKNDPLCRPVDLGGLHLQGRLVLAPMAGITDDVFRMLCHRYGAALTYTEMVSAQGLLMSQKSRELLQSKPEGGPVAAQLFGHDADVVAKAASWVEHNCEYISMIDINMGCPAHKIVKSGDGAALLKNIELAGRILEKTIRAVRLPVSAKIRIGFDCESNVADELSRIARDAGVCAVAVHGRTADQGYSGRADWDAIGKVKRLVGASMAVIGNGDIQNRDQARLRLEQSGCDAVMVGRAAIGAPWVFSENIPSSSERLSVILEHLAMEEEKYGGAYAVTSMRKLLAAYIRGMPGAAKTRASIFKATDSQYVRSELEDLFNADGGESVDKTGDL